MAVYTDGTAYGVPAGLMYSMPVTTKAGVWSIVPGLLDGLEPERKAFLEKEMASSSAELIEERTLALE